MSKYYLSLVLVEVPDHVKKTPYAAWFYAVSIEQAKIRDGLLELVYCDGTVKIFNSEETQEILLECGEVLNRFLWENDYSLENNQSLPLGE